MEDPGRSGSLKPVVDALDTRVDLIFANGGSHLVSAG
jgi:hypothetical protein